MFEPLDPRDLDKMHIVEIRHLLDKKYMDYEDLIYGHSGHFIWTFSPSRHKDMVRVLTEEIDLILTYLEEYE